MPGSWRDSRSSIHNTISSLRRMLLSRLQACADNEQRRSAFGFRGTGPILTARAINVVAAVGYNEASFLAVG
ncbi:hypothetical protein HZ326_22746 [Fusarium oxysporum f. sp. albedinis]|nr:hypothetical protein HZ326_22746 [Fusarium oxysporum f. sp. albedinis]